MSFILKLFFTGLMAFVPSEDGKEMTVLLLNVNHNYQSSDGSSLPHHKPLLIARAAVATASRLDPQRRLTVEPGTSFGNPASSRAMRATLRLSSPA